MTMTTTRNKHPGRPRQPDNCKQCGTKLTIHVNWKEYNQKDSRKICNTCWKKYQQRYNKTYREKKGTCKGVMIPTHKDCYGMTRIPLRSLVEAMTLCRDIQFEGYDKNEVLSLIRGGEWVVL